MRRLWAHFSLIGLFFLATVAGAIPCERAAQNKYVCIGSNGFIGSALAQKFSSKESFIGVSRSPGPNTQVAGRLEDFTQERWCSEVTSVDDPVIFFAAGRPAVGEAKRDPQGDYDALIKPLQKLLEFMPAGTLFFISSAAVYSPDEIGPYARHRILAEEMVREHATTHADFKYHILRPSNVFGEHQQKQIIFDLGKRFRQDSRDKKETTLWGTGEEARDFIHVDYIADFCERLDAQKTPSDTWNICSGKPTTIASLVDSVRSYFGFSNTVLFDGKFGGSENPLDTEKSAQILSPEPYTFEARKDSVLKAYRAVYEKADTTTP